MTHMCSGLEPEKTCKKKSPAETAVESNSGLDQAKPYRS